MSGGSASSSSGAGGRSAAGGSSGAGSSSGSGGSSGAGGSSEPVVAAIATAVARVILSLYPRAVRADIGAAILRDIRLQVVVAAETSGGWAAWRRLPALVASLVANGFGAWRDVLARHTGNASEGRAAGSGDSGRAIRRTAASMPRLRGHRRRGIGSRFHISVLDFKLGLRMTARHPGLTLIGTFGLTIAITLGVLFASAVQIVYAELPFPDGDRLVAIENWDLEINNQDYRNLHDYLTWREELTTVEELGAYRTVRRNLIDADGHAQSVAVAEITAAGFRLPGVPPLLGRTLLDADLRPDAPSVLLIGHDLWRSRFGADPDVVGREVRLGSATHTVIGVMPEGFAFPLAHQLWAPLHIDPNAFGRREGPNIRVFGRLAAGATLETAQAELGAIGRRLSDAFPRTHEHIRPSIIPYTAQPWDDMNGVELPLLGMVIVLLLVVIAANVATLVYARTATRRSELLVRTALGASRSTLVGQLFVEALLIALAAAVLGIAVAGFAIERLNVFIESLTTGGGAWFWMRFALSPATIAWAFALAVLGAVIAGALPALGATGYRVQSGLQGFSGGTEAGMGRTWTALIVAQVAFAVAVLPMTVFMAWEMTRYGLAEPDFPADEYVVGFLYLDPGADGGVEELARQRATAALDFDVRYATLLGELERRLQGELGATGVAYVASFPGDYPTVRIEVEGIGADGGATATHRAAVARVEPAAFDLVGVTQLAGRRFADADVVGVADVVIVNRSFIDDVLGGAAATGRRIRHVSGYRAGGVERSVEGTEPGVLYEIIGVVEDFPRRATEPGMTTAHVYHPMGRGQAYPAGLIARLPASSGNALQGTRDIAAAVDPTLRFTTLQTLGDRLGEMQAGQRLAGLGLGLVTLGVTLLSMAGLWALMSYAVVRRHREIGIRRALGGRRAGILASIFGRVLVQLGLGTAVGLAFATLFSAVVGAELGDTRGYGFVLGVFAALLVVALLAALGPARRGLRIEPTEALRE